MKKRIVSALLSGFLLVSATACGKQPAADAAQPVADPTQAYLDTVDVDYAYDLALKLEDIRNNETLGYRTAGSDAELATGDMLKAEMERIGLQNVTKDAFTLDTQDSLFGLSRRCIPSWVSHAHPTLPSRRICHFIDSLKRPPFGGRFSTCGKPQRFKCRTKLRRKTQTQLQRIWKDLRIVENTLENAKKCPETMFPGTGLIKFV